MAPSPQTTAPATGESQEALRQPSGGPPVASSLLSWARANWIPVALFVGAFAVLAAFSGPRFLHQSKAPQFIYQAAAFLEGKLELTVDPPNNEDWARVGDKFYVSFPAFPSLVMLPFVALWSYQFNDTSFTVALAALGAALFYLLLRKLARSGDSSRTPVEDALLSLLFSFGSVYFYCSIRGEVWFTAEVIGVLLTCLYAMFAHRAERPVLAGLAFSAATLTRTPLLFAGAFFLWELFFPEGKPSIDALRGELGLKLKKLLRFSLAAAPLALLGLWFNYARFGNPFEFGHRLLWNNRVNADITRYGLFHYQFLERNLHAALTRLPTLDFHPLRLGYDPHGMALWVTTPLLLLLLWPKTIGRLSPALWATVAATALPGLFYQNDGYMQFGFRFALDYTPYLFLLLAVGGWPMKRAFLTLGALGVAVNIWGALAFHGFSW